MPLDKKLRRPADRGRPFEPNHELADFVVAGENAPIGHVVTFRLDGVDQPLVAHFRTHDEPFASCNCKRARVWPIISALPNSMSVPLSI